MAEPPSPKRHMWVRFLLPLPNRNGKLVKATMPPEQGVEPIGLGDRVPCCYGL